MYNRYTGTIYMDGILNKRLKKISEVIADDMHREGITIDDIRTRRVNISQYIINFHGDIAHVVKQTMKNEVIEEDEVLQTVYYYVGKYLRYHSSIFK